MPENRRKRDSSKLVWDSKPKRAPNPKDIEFQTAELVIPNAAIACYCWRDNRGIQRKYEPDFLIKNEDTMFLFEAKGDHLITHSDTALKAQAAIAWCLSASRVAPQQC